jgi:hypothetical protein
MEPVGENVTIAARRSVCASENAHPQEKEKKEREKRREKER